MNLNKMVINNNLHKHFRPHIISSTFFGIWIIQTGAEF